MSASGYDSVSVTENLSISLLSEKYTAVVNSVVLQLKIFKVTPRKRLFSRDKKIYNKIYEGGTRW